MLPFLIKTNMLPIIFLATKNAIGSALILQSLARYALNNPLKAGLCGYKVATILRSRYNEATLNILRENGDANSNQEVGQ